MAKSLHTKEYEIFCRLLQQARESARLSQQELAERLGKPQSYVSKYENGERRLDVAEFASLCEALGANPKKILERFLAEKDK